MDEQTEHGEPQVNVGYAIGQLAKALTTSQSHPDPSTRQRADGKVERWLKVFEGMVAGFLDVGSRTPVSGIPAWATLEVVTGGFATGQLLAGGALLDHERALVSEIGQSDDDARRTLNRYFLTDAGMARLQSVLASGKYEVDVPEEGTLLVVAWLLQHGHGDAARDLLSEIGPFLGRLRFYPAPAEQPRRYSASVYLHDVANTVNDLQRIQPNAKILAQKEAIEVWAPLYDRTINLFLDTVEGEPPQLDYQGDSTPIVEGGWPCMAYPAGWAARAQQLLDEYETTRRSHVRCGKPESKKGTFLQLRRYLQQCIDDTESITERDASRVRTLLARALYRRGKPGSTAWNEIRSRQANQVRGPTYHEITQVVVGRLKQLPQDRGIDDLDAATQPITQAEAEKFEIAAAAVVPECVRRKIERCLADTVNAHVERGVITSGETLARVLPQVTSGLQAAGIADPALRQLYAAIYRAFRRRRSLLLLNLESQVKIDELPWVSAIHQFRRDDLTTRDLSKATLQEITALTLISFPYAIIPNKLLQELRALAQQAKLELPLVDEVAADIFMGQFSGKFVQAAKLAAERMQGTLYATYYGIDAGSILELPVPRKTKAHWFGRRPTHDRFMELCSSRAGVSYGGWKVAANGMIIEQQQILTTQNLAVLLWGLDLVGELRDYFPTMARRCFESVCKRQQNKPPNWHAYLIMIKNTAYAWRQMILFLSLLPDGELQHFMNWARGHLADQSAEFQGRFEPAMRGLERASNGESPEAGAVARRFLGWTTERHWILGPKHEE